MMSTLLYWPLPLNPTPLRGAVNVTGTRAFKLRGWSRRTRAFAFAARTESPSRPRPNRPARVSTARRS
ncbi:unnamed protein product, partial [Iphiclides podalirius]